MKTTESERQRARDGGVMPTGWYDRLLADADLLAELEAAIRARIEVLNKLNQNYHGRGMQRESSQCYGGVLALVDLLGELEGDE